MTARGLLVTAFLCAPAIALGAGGVGGAPAAALDARRVAWRELRFSGHKMGLSATVDVTLDAGPAPLTDGPPSGTGPSEELLLESTTHLPGRVFVASERIDPAQARARQIVDTETGAKNHRKTYTLTPHGFLLDLLEPASGPESLLPSGRWTRRSMAFTPFPRGLAPGTPITGPVGLIYAVSAAGLAAPGDALTVHVLVQTQVERVTVRVEGVEPVELDFSQSASAAPAAVRERLSALRLVARSEPVDAASASAFRIFGLEGDVEILWDAARRLPVEIAGNVKVLGHVRLRLASTTSR